MNISRTNWYVFYTYPKCEKAALTELLQRNYTAYLPIIKSYRYWKNRQRKIIDTNLFPGYIFVYARENQITDIVQISKICFCLKTGNKPCKILEGEIDAIRNMLASGKEIFVDHKLSAGERVEITNGPLMGYTGILVECDGKRRFGIQLKELNKTVTIDISSVKIKQI